MCDMVMLRGPVLGEELENGPGKRIVYLRVGEAQPAADFLQGLTLRHEAKFRAQFRNMAERGWLPPEQFSKVERGSGSGNGGIWTFKTAAHRLLCFHEAGRVIVLVGGTQINRKIPRS